MEEVAVGGSTSVLQLSAIGSVGSVDLTVSAGSGNYTYLWNSGQTTQDVSGLPTGKYSVVVTDMASGCKARLDIDVTGAEISAQVTDASCQPNGKIIVNSVTGTSEPLSYYINGLLNPAGAGNPQFIGLAPGSYTIKVKAVSGFELSASLTVGGSGSAPQLSYTSTDGNIDLSVSGGSGSYSYLWSNGATTQDLGGLGAGNYTVEVTDLLTLCKTSITAMVDRPVEPTFQLTAAVCAPNGAIVVSGLPAGLTNIRFTINGAVNPAGVDDPRFSDLSPGDYLIQITADNNYSFQKSITLAGTLAPVLTYRSIDRSIDLSVTGGGGNYSYLWSNGATTEDLVDLSAGKYTVTVSDLNSGCKSVQTVTVTPWDMVVSVVNARCAANGTIEVVSVTGGNGAYRYYLNNVPGPSGGQFSGLAAGTYTVKVEDNQGFAISRQVSVGGTSVPLVLSGVINGRAIDLIVAGGSGNYIYLWSNGSSSEDLVGATSGTHSVTVSDGLTGCQAFASFTVGVPSARVVVTNASCLNTGKLLIQDFNGMGMVNYYINGNINPNGSSSPEFTDLAPGSYSLRAESPGGFIWEGQFTVSKNANPPIVSAHASAGEIKLMVSGGSGGFTYKWSNGATTKDLSNVYKGKYVVTITDVVTGCEAVFSVELLTGPPIVDQKIFMFPNPAISGSATTLKYDFPDAARRDVSLVDLLGRVIWKGEVSSKAGELQVSLSGVPPGIYILQIGGKSRVSRQLIVKS
ncbi:T9SS type A sorting domain-containing protein [uncultured Pedobacter sp.]|uniref:T9SS type A sorting domain-containing protein n=1 Tax=uncultured Pedobacter sp. TaxID=246139 RepID=UPI00262425E3|nr:T9SS type A sorting domain-containing protein [uncultured Pedobacter sp.]